MRLKVLVEYLTYQIPESGGKASFIVIDYVIDGHTAFPVHESCEQESLTYGGMPYVLFEELEKLLSAAYTAGAKGRGLAFECRADGKNAAVIYYEGENVIFRGNAAKGGEKRESE